MKDIPKCHLEDWIYISMYFDTCINYFEVQCTTEYFIVIAELIRTIFMCTTCKTMWGHSSIQGIFFSLGST